MRDSGILIGPFALIVIAIPAILLGEWAIRRWVWLRRSHVPPAIVGGLALAGVLLVVGRIAPGWIGVSGSTTNPFWLWSVTPHWGLVEAKPTDVERPFLILFFTCIGLNASVRLAREGGWPLAKYLGIAAVLGVVQAGVGAAAAVGLGQHPLLGVMAGNVALMGGFGTAAGFAPDFEAAGLSGAPTIGLASAAFGVIAGGLVAGWVGGRLVETKLGRKASEVDAPPAAGGAGSVEAGAFAADVREVLAGGTTALVHLVVILACMKLGAFVSVAIQSFGITFPIYMGAMLVAGAVRNLHDALGGQWLETRCTDAIGVVALTWMLAVVMIDLQLGPLLGAALPLIAILALQVGLLAAAAYWCVFRVMGRDYEAAMLSAGMVGFGLGATSNALATMRVLAARFGPAPRAFLIVPLVGAFLVDFANALVTTGALNFLR